MTKTKLTKAEEKRIAGIERLALEAMGRINKTRAQFREPLPPKKRKEFNELYLIDIIREFCPKNKGEG